MKLEDAAAVKVGDTDVAAIYIGETQVWPVDPGPPAGDAPTVVDYTTGGGWIGGGTFTLTLPTLDGVGPSDLVLVFVSMTELGVTYSGTGWTQIASLDTDGSSTIGVLQGTGSSASTVTSSHELWSTGMIAIAWSDAAGVELGDPVNVVSFGAGEIPVLEDVPGFTAPGPASAIAVGVGDWGATWTLTGDPGATSLGTPNDGLAGWLRGDFDTGVVDDVEGTFNVEWQRWVAIQVAAYSSP